MQKLKWQRIDRATAIYALIDPTTGLIRYVGKTTQKLRCRLATHLHHARNPTGTQGRFWSKNWVASLLREGKRPLIVELEVIPEFGDWAEAERFWIEMCRSWGFDLCNLRGGGEAGNFCKQSPETIEKRVSKLRGRPTGKKMTSERKRALREGWLRWRTSPAFSHEKARAIARKGIAAAALVPRRKGGENPNARAIVIAGTRYPSIAEAMLAIGVTRRTIHNWLRDGCAAYAAEVTGAGPVSPEVYYSTKPRRGREIVGAFGTYPSMGFLARKLGIDASTVAYRLERGLVPDAPAQPTGLRTRNGDTSS